MTCFNTCSCFVYSVPLLLSPKLRSVTPGPLSSCCLQVCNQEEILELDAQSLGELLALDELEVSEEQQVLEVVMRWAQRHSGDSQSEAEAAQLLRHVRLELVEPQFLHRARRRNPVGEPHRSTRSSAVGQTFSSINIQCGGN